MIKIPAPFDKYYRLMSDKEYEDYTGDTARPYICEDVDGYNVKHYSYCLAKPEYEDYLADKGLDIVELVSSDWDPNKLMLGYVVGGRIYSVDESDLPDEDLTSSTKITASDDEEDDDWYDDDDNELYDESKVVPAIQSALKISEEDANTVYEWYNNEGSFEDFDSLDDFIDYMKDDIYDMIDAADDQELADRIRESIESSTKVTGSIDTGLQYWYLTKHGLGPGMMPRDAHLIDVVEDGYDTYVLLDKMLTTDELNYFDMKEKWPPEELLASCTIEGATAEELQKKFAEYTEKQNKVGKQLDDLQENVKKKSGLFSKRKKVESAECRKVSEDADGIHYVVGSEEERPWWIVDAPIPDDPYYDNKRLSREIADEEDFYDRIHHEGEYENDDYDYEEDYKDVFGSEGDEEDDFLSQPEQEFKSEKTAVNGKQGKLPAVFKKANIPSGALVLDYGGGTPESEAVAQAYLDQFDAKEMIYDPFNQTPEHNRQVVAELRSNGGADVAICSNVLNVIKEEDVRLDLLNKIKKLLKDGATAYISVYEGSGKGEGSATQDSKSFQNNRKIGGYLEEVQQVFPDATRKGSVIIAPNTKSAKKDIESSTDIDAINLDDLRSEIAQGCEEYLTGPKGGYNPSGSPKESKWDMNADEVYFIDINKDMNCIRVEVRAELSYEGMINMSELLDPIVEKYDPDSYFDMVEPGIMEAYLCNYDVTASTAINGATEEDAFNELDRDLFNPPYPDDEEDELEDIELDFNVDIHIDVKDDGDWEESIGEENLSDEIDFDDSLIDSDQLEEDLRDILVWSIPYNPGKYHLMCHVYLKYRPELNYFGEYKYALDSKDSKVTDVEITNEGTLSDSDNEIIEEMTEVDDVESSEDVEEEEDKEEIEASTSQQPVKAGMTDEDVEDAILNGRPFDLESFNRFSGQDNHEGELLASDIEVGDIFQINNSDIVDYGTILKVLSINDPEIADPYFDYTFRCEVVEPADEKSSSEVGDIREISFDKDEYVGKLIPV